MRGSIFCAVPVFPGYAKTGDRRFPSCSICHDPFQKGRHGAAVSGDTIRRLTCGRICLTSALCVSNF